MGKDLKPFGTIDDFYTVQEDMHEYQNLYGLGIAMGDIILPAIGGAASGYLALRIGINPVVGTITGKVASADIFNKLKDRYLENLKKEKTKHGK